MSGWGGHRAGCADLLDAARVLSLVGNSRARVYKFRLPYLTAETFANCSFAT